MHVLVVALERERADRVDELAVERVLAAGEAAPADAAEHLAAVPVREQAVAQRAGLGVLAHEVEHLADVAVVALGIEPPVRRVAARCRAAPSGSTGRSASTEMPAAWK